ncbi:MAG: uroporphyrinogen-III C-methyltransferase, partial [Burkholderiales bacterium]|nr:uroporphyrinogen-III C-methyltransferase [Burkholderiales bacterium]
MSSAPINDKPETTASIPTPVRLVWWRQKLLVLSLVLAVLCALACLQLWLKLSTMQEQLARQSADAGQLSVQANSMAKHAEQLTQETAARVALLDARLSEVALQRSQLEELMQSLSRSRDENLVVDIESALGLAQQQAELTGSVQPMLAALQTAQKRLGKVPQPRLAPVLRALQHDIERLQSTSLTDIPGLLIRLDELVALVDTLPVLNAVGPNSRSVHAPDKAPLRTWTQIWQDKDWAAVGQRIWAEVSGLVRVSRIEQPEAAMLSPEQSFFVRENMKLRLLNARLALLSRQIASARNDLAVAERDLAQFFDTASRQGHAAQT